MNEIGTQAREITSLSTYDGQTFDLTAFRTDTDNADKPLVLFFINVASAARANAWLNILRALRSSDTVETNIRPVAVCFNHNGTGIINMINNTAIQNAVRDDGQLDSDFTGVTICRNNPIADPTTSFAGQYLSEIESDDSLYGRPDPSPAPMPPALFNDAITSYQMWGCILQPSLNTLDQPIYVVTDKWHADRNNDPLSLIHLLDTDETFPSEDILFWDDTKKTLMADLIAERCGNLRSPLVPLRTYPAQGTPLSALPDPVKIAFSRPLDKAFAETPANWIVSGSGVDIASGGVDTSAANPYTGVNYIENTSELSFSDASLDDTGGTVMSLSFTGLSCESDDVPSVDNSVSWNVDTTTPVVTSVKIYAMDSSTEIPAVADPLHLNRPTLAYSTIYLELTLNEPLQDPTDQSPTPDAVLPFNISSATDNSAENAVASFDEATPTVLELTFDVKFDARDGVFDVSLPAGSVLDKAGNTFPPVGGSDWMQKIAYDCEAPAAELSYEDAALSDNDTISRHELIVKIHFDKSATIDTTVLLDCEATNTTVSYEGNDGADYLYRWKPQNPGNTKLKVKNGAGKDFLGRDTLESGERVLTYAPTYKDIVLTVDASSSMGYEILFDPDNIGAPPEEKWDVMRPRIKKVLSELNAQIASGTVDPLSDRLGLVVYDTTARTVRIAGADWIIADKIGSESDMDLETLLDTITPKARTAMGSAIGEAYKLLDSRGTTSIGEGAVILFADGEQNEGADIDINDAAGQVLIGPPYNLDIQVGNSGIYPIHTVGISYSTASGNQLIQDLERIATYSGGLFMNVTEIDLDTTANMALGSIFDEIYSGSTPVAIKRYAGAIARNHPSGRIPFILGNDTSGLMVSLSWPGSRQLSFMLRRNGKVVRHFDRVRKGAMYSIGAIALPHRQSTLSGPFYMEEFIGSWDPVFPFRAAVSGNTSRSLFEPVRREKPGFLTEVFTPDGNWDVVLSREGGISTDERPYFLNIVAEQSGPEFTFIPPKLPFETMKPYEFIVDVSGPITAIHDAAITVTGCPVSLMNTVQAYAGQMEYKEPVIFSPDVVKPSELNLEYKKMKLVNRILKDRIREVSRLSHIDAALHHPSSEVFRPAGISSGKTGSRLTWKLPAFRYPGINTLSLRIQGSGSGTRNGSFERTINRCIVITPGIDRKKSIISYKQDPNSLKFEAIVIPQDSRGNLLGSGYADRLIGYDHVIGSLQVEDRLDGSYLVKGTRRKPLNGKLKGFSLRFVNRHSRLFQP